MRLPLIPLNKLDTQTRPLYESMKEGIERNFKGFKAVEENGSLIGPWNPWLRYSKFGEPVWGVINALASSSNLPKAVREVAILVAGAKFKSGYEIYAHVLVAELVGISNDKIAAIVAGRCPANLTHEEAVGYDVASSLVSGGILPELCYRRAVAAFGEEGAGELVYLVGLYCAVSVILNGFDVPVP